MKKKKKLKLDRIFFILVIFLAIIYFLIKSFIPKDSLEKIASNSINFLSNNSGYDIIKEDINPLYNGIGQEKVSGKDRIFYYFYDSR